MFNPEYQSMGMSNNPYAASYHDPYNRNMRRPNAIDMDYQAPMGQIPQNFAEGGMIEEPRKQKKEKVNPYPSLAEMIRQQGKGEDSILAHINPLEALMLQQMGGSGTVNPATGLPQFGFLKNPLKALKGNAGGILGSIIGNMILPGVGGAVGGALGGAAGSALRGRKDYGQAALRGGLTGLALPTAAGFAGSSANALGMNSTGNFLTNYGTENAIMPSLGKMIGDNSVGNSIGQTGVNTGSSEAGGLSDMITAPAEKSKDSWFSSLMKPKNMLTAAAVAGSFLNRPKEKTPERLAEEQKRFNKASMLSTEERAAQEANMLAEEQMKRRIARNKYLPEERFEVKPLYRRASTPAEYGRTGKWLNYYDNPGMSGNPLLMKKGGRIRQIPKMSFEEEEMEYPSGQGYYIRGNTGGQDDKVPIDASDGEYIIPTDVVSIQGDGNSEAGGNWFDKFVEKVRKNAGRKNKLPPKAKSVNHYLKKKTA